MKFENIAKYITPPVISQLNNLSKNVFSYQTKIDAISKAMPYSKDIYNLIGANLLSSIAPLSTLQDKMSSFHNAMKCIPDISRIFNSSIILQNKLPWTTSNMSLYIDDIIKLQNHKLNCNYIKMKHEEAFVKIPHFTIKQKASLLRAELSESESLFFGSSDIKNAGLVSTTVQNTVLIMDGLTQNPEPFNIDGECLYDFEDELKENLLSLNQSFFAMLLGAKQAARSSNPDKVRQVATSLRELIKKVINTLIPNKEYEIFRSDPLKQKPSIDNKLSYFFGSINETELEQFVLCDVTLITKILSLLNNCIHRDERINDKGLEYLISKIESFILLLLRYNQLRTPKEPPHA